MGTLESFIFETPLATTMIGENMKSGFMLAFTLAGILTIGNGLSTWVLGGKTLSSEVKRVTGIGGNE